MLCGVASEHVKEIAHAAAFDLVLGQSVGYTQTRGRRAVAVLALTILARPKLAHVAEKVMKPVFFWAEKKGGIS